MVGRDVITTDIKEQAFQIRRENFPDEINFYAPGLKRYATEEFTQQNPRAFLPISLTGGACALQCDHCKAKILDPMIAPDQEQGLFNLCKKLADSGTEGVLISGGSRKDGGVPVLKYVDDIARIKQELGLRVLVHTGLVSENTARELKQAGVDGVMIDIIGANETIRDVYHLDATTQDFDRSLEWLVKYEHSVRPHIILGLHYGKILGEYHALEIIKKYPVHALILVILTPLVGTPMYGIAPPEVSELEEFFQEARVQMPDTLIMLGCARPLGEHKLAIDRAAVDCGLNGIAYPADGIIRYSQSRGLQPKFFENACACGC